MTPETTIAIFSAFYMISFFLSICANGFLVFVILYRTPKCIGNYKWFLLNMTVVDILMSFIFDEMLAMIPLAPRPIFLIDGFAKYFGAGFSPFLVCTATSSLFLSLALPLLCFIYRYAVTKKTRVANSTPQKCELSTFFTASLFEIIWATATFAVTFFVTNTDQQLLRTKQKHLRTFFNASRYQPQIYFGFGEQLDTLRTVASVVILAMVVAITAACIILATVIIRSLNAKRESMSQTTFAMQKRFTHALIIQALYPAILLTLPYLGVSVDIYFGVLRSTGYIIAIQLLSIACVVSYPIVNCMVTIYFVTPYRMTVIDIARRLCASGPAMLRVRATSWGSRLFLDQPFIGRKNIAADDKLCEEQTCIAV